MRPKVSIIVPVFNSELFIKACVKSLLQQTYEQIEIIIVDDGSTDGSYLQAKAFESDQCIVIQQKNAGAAVARNTGLQHATGDYIQFLDADDFLSIDKIEKQVAALAGGTDKVAVCNFIEFNKEEDIPNAVVEKKQTGYIYSTNDTPGFLINLWIGNNDLNFIQTNCWLVPRALIEKAGHWREYRCPDDDGEFFTRVLLASGGIVYVPGVYNYYRKGITGNNLSKSINKKYLQNSLLTIDLKHSYLLARVTGDDLNKAIAKQYFDFSIFSYPRFKVLSAIAYKRYKAFNEKLPLPQLGGGFIEMIKKTLGWKTARRVRYFLRGI